MGKGFDHGLKREDLIHAAFRVISKKGLAAATVREVAREAGRSSGALQHYIPSKDKLLIEVSDYSASLIRARMVAVEQKYSGIDALRRVVCEVLPLDAERAGHRRIWLGFWERSSENSTFRRIMQDRYDEGNGRYARMIEKAKTDGDIRADVDPRFAAESLTTLIDGINVQALVSRRPMSPAQQRQHLDEWIEKYLDPRPAKRK